MTRLLLAGAVVAGALALATPATACTLDSCWFTQPVCSRVNCHVCFIRPDGSQWCIS